MKVKELIKELQRCDPESRVLITEGVFTSDAILGTLEWAGIYDGDMILACNGPLYGIEVLYTDGQSTEDEE